MTPKEVLALCREKDVKAVDLRFMDFPGLWQHFTIPVNKLDEDVFEDGLGFDGSSIRGWQAINESDMLVVPQPETAVHRSVHARSRRSSMICNIQDPITREDYTPRSAQRRPQGGQLPEEHRHRRHVLHRPRGRVLHLRRRPLRPERATQATTTSTASKASGTAAARRSPNLGYKLRYKEGYFPVPPADQLMDIRNEMMQTMIECGLDVEAQHHEVATAGQSRNRHEVRRAGDDGRQDDACTSTSSRTSPRSTTRRSRSCPSRCSATTAPACTPTSRCGRAASRCSPAAATPGLSEMALYAIGGLLKHAPAILAFTNPTTNSYKRLVPGYEAPVNLAYSQRNRSASCRIPMYSPSPKAKRVEFRCPDPSCNPYLAFSAMLMAAIDGIQNKIHPGEPLDKDIYDLAPEELAEVPKTPGSLDESLDGSARRTTSSCSAATCSPQDVIDTWIWYKRKNEVDAMRLRPHPYEFCLYYDM